MKLSITSFLILSCVAGAGASGQNNSAQQTLTIPSISFQVQADGQPKLVPAAAWVTIGDDREEKKEKTVPVSLEYDKATLRIKTQPVTVVLKRLMLWQGSWIPLDLSVLPSHLGQNGETVYDAQVGTRIERARLTVIFNPRIPSPADETVSIDGADVAYSSLASGKEFEADAFGEQKLAFDEEDFKAFGLSPEKTVVLATLQKLTGRIRGDAAALYMEDSPTLKVWINQEALTFDQVSCLNKVVASEEPVTLFGVVDRGAQDWELKKPSIPKEVLAKCAAGGFVAKEHPKPATKQEAAPKPHHKIANKNKLNSLLQDPWALEGGRARGE